MLHVPGENIALAVVDSCKLLEHVSLVLRVSDEQVVVGEHQHLGLVELDVQVLEEHALLEHEVLVLVGFYLVEGIDDEGGPHTCDALQQLIVLVLRGSAVGLRHQLGLDLMHV